MEYDVGSSPTALQLSAAVLAALAATSMVAPEAYAKANAIQRASWNAPDASPQSFQSLGVFHGSIAATTKSVESDSWQELEALEDDWDGSEAQRVSPDALEHARRFSRSISTIAAPFTPFAHPDGSVGLESQTVCSAAYLIVSPSNRFTYVLRIGEAVHRGDDVESDKMRELLALLY